MLLTARKRVPRKAEDVAKRVADFEDEPPAGEGVVPLNPGFFKLQRMRASAVKEQPQ